MNSKDRVLEGKETRETSESAMKYFSMIGTKQIVKKFIDEDLETGRGFLRIIEMKKNKGSSERVQPLGVGEIWVTASPVH
mmetsp:Transcript_16601/g.39487  ORF Transcript_16601/g.39487 Transcript_16601/m.39487 type:complete len:80 (-) Transcript_16601:172-411(-)